MNKQELRRHVASISTPLITAGFVEMKTRPLTLGRQRGPLLDLVDFGLGRGGRSLEVVVSTWTPFVPVEPVGFDTEIDLSYIGIAAGGHLSTSGVGRWTIWLVADTDEISKTFTEVGRALKEYALPWFDGIVDGETFAKACSIANGGWWQTIRKIRRDFIQTSIDRALRGEIEVKPFQFVSKRPSH